MKKLNSKGFTAVEGLLIVLILVIIGFGGYYVWNTRHKSPSISTTSTAKTTNPASNSTKNTTSTQKYLAITQWGVEFKLNSNNSDANYKLTDADDIFLSSNSLDAFAAQNQDCSSANQSVTIQRVLTQDLNPDARPADIRAVVGDYTYSEDFGQPCFGSDSQVQSLNSQAQQLINQLPTVKDLVANQ